MFLVSQCALFHRSILFVASYQYFIFHATCFKQFVSLVCDALYNTFKLQGLQPSNLVDRGHFGSHFPQRKFRNLLHDAPSEERV